MRAEPLVLASRRSQLSLFDHLLGPSAQFTVARDARGSDAGRKATGNLGNISYRLFPRTLEPF